MPIFDQVTHSATVAKWKVNQQKQIFQTQGEINNLNNKINTQKQMLGEQAYKLFLDGSISDQMLLSICEKILELNQQKTSNEQELESIKAQLPPLPPSQTYPANYIPGSKLVCPICHNPVEARFCTKCGVEGVPRGNT